MIPPCAQNVLQSFGSAAFVISRQRIPAEARVNAVVSPAIPVPITIAGKCSRFLSLGNAGVLYLTGADKNVCARWGADIPVCSSRRRLRETGDHVRPALDVLLDLDDVVRLRVLEQVAERVVAVVLLVERQIGRASCRAKCNY